MKKVLKACVDDTMCDAAKEAIVYATIANNEQEILDEIMVFFESRDNGNGFDRSQGRLKERFSIEDIHILDNRDGSIDVKDTMFVFRDFSSYGNYRIYDFTDFDSYYHDDYYFITNQENKIIAYIKKVDKINSYSYLGDNEVYISSLEDCLDLNDLDGEIKPSYTYGELEDLRESLNSNNINNTLK